MQLGSDEHDAARLPRALPGDVAARRRFPGQQPSRSRRPAPAGRLHLPPVFVDGELIAFAGSTRAPSRPRRRQRGPERAWPPTSTRKGCCCRRSSSASPHDWNGGTFERLLAANIRVPDQTLGDFNAQFAAKAIGIERIRQLCAKYGVGQGQGDDDGAQDYAERRCARRFARLPTASIYGEDAGDDIEGKTTSRCGCGPRSPSRATRWRSTSRAPARRSAATSIRPSPRRSRRVMSCIKGVLIGGDVPFNEGSFRPVTIKVPYGSILNPRPPAPGARTHAALLSRVRRGDEGAGAGGARARDRLGLRLHAGIACLARLGDGRYACAWKPTAAASARRRTPTARMASPPLCRTPPIRRSSARHGVRLLPHRRLHAQSGFLRPWPRIAAVSALPPLRDPQGRRPARHLLRTAFGWPPRACWVASPASAAIAASSAPTARPRNCAARPRSTSPRATSSRCSWAAARASAG